MTGTSDRESLRRVSEMSSMNGSRNLIYTHNGEVH
jgi:hypothetical protein